MQVCVLGAGIIIYARLSGGRTERRSLLSAFKVRPRRVKRNGLQPQVEDVMLAKSQLAWSHIEPCGWVSAPALHRALMSDAALPRLVVRFNAPVRKHVTS